MRRYIAVLVAGTVVVLLGAAGVIGVVSGKLPNLLPGTELLFFALMCVGLIFIIIGYVLSRFETGPSLMSQLAEYCYCRHPVFQERSTHYDGQCVIVQQCDTCGGCGAWFELRVIGVREGVPYSFLPERLRNDIAKRVGNSKNLVSVH